LAYGGLALIKNFPNLDKLFEDGKHVLIFKDRAEASRKIVEFENSKFSEKIRRAGWRRQQVKHTVLYRLQNIMSNALGWDDTFWGYL
jgi:spore maturation protein CgeB